MCNVYTGVDSSLYDTEARSIRIQGCVTSVRLENGFWAILDKMAASEATTTPGLLNNLYSELLQKKGEVKNFASFLRVACTIYERREGPISTTDTSQTARITNRIT